MVIHDFSSKAVFLDTAPLIYFIEGQSQFQSVLETVFKLNDSGDFVFITTSITLLEVLVKPIRDNRKSLVQQYKMILSQAPNMEILQVDNLIGEKAAVLRATYNLKTPDAIQLAAAVISGCNYFLTNDKRLNVVKEISIITLNDII